MSRDEDIVAHDVEGVSFVWLLLLGLVVLRFFLIDGGFVLLIEMSFDEYFGVFEELW